MNAADLQRLAEDLRHHAGLRTEVFPDPNPEGLHVMRINNVDFFFRADGSGYDGWGEALDRAQSEINKGAENIETEGEPMNKNSSLSES